MSTDYVPEPATAASYAALCALSMEAHSCRLVRVNNAGPSPLLLPPDPQPVPLPRHHSYALTDGTNLLHLDFGPDQKVAIATQYAFHSVQALLPHCGTLHSEHSPQFEEMLILRDEAQP